MFGMKTTYKYKKLSSNDDIQVEETVLGSEESDEEINEDCNQTSLRKSIKDDCGEIIIAKEDSLSDVEIYEIDIDGADGPQSLQTIAMKYNCSTWELKRVNNLHNNQEFYALRTIKVAAMKNSYRSELLQRHGRLLTKDGIQCALLELADCSNSNADSDDITAQNKPTFVRHISIRSSILNDPEGGHEFLKSMDSDLQKIRESVTNHKTSLEEVTSTLTTPTIFPPTNPHGNTATRMIFDIFKEPSCEMNNKRLFTILFLCFVVVPIFLLAVFFYKKYFAQPP